MPVLQTGLAKSAAEAYTIDQSLRFDDGDSAYLSWTPGSAGDRKTWTWSGWVKRSTITTEQTIFGVSTGSNNDTYGLVQLTSGDQIQFGAYDHTACKTTRLMRDPGGWFHLVVAMDTNNSTALYRCRIYINGAEVTDWATSPSTITLDVEYAVNNNLSHRIGSTVGGHYLDSYLAEVYFIDGTQLTPSSFGETDAATNQWKPIDAKDDLTFGTNGFYQKYSSTELANSFTDSSSSSHTITANGDVTNTRAQSKVGDSSIAFDGNDALQVGHSSDFDFGDNSFTAECWVRFSSLTGYQNIMNHAAGGGRSLLIWKLISSNYIDASLSSDGGSFDTGNCTSTTGLSADTWYHIAYVRDGDDFELFINGTSEDTATSSTAAYDSSSDLYIGSWYEGSASQGVVGYADEIRISDSARYTSNFTPQTTAFTADANTKLLIHSDWTGGLGADSSGNGNAFSVTNLVATDQMIDTPTNNFATLNPLVPPATTGSIFSEGNLKYRTYKTGGDNVQGEGTIGFTSGKWYWEIYLVGFEGSVTRRGGIGVGDAKSNETWTTACTEAAVLTVGNLNPQTHNVVAPSTGDSWSVGAAGDIWCCAFDADAGTFIITKNTAVTGSETTGKWTGFATSTIGYRPITVEQSGNDYTEFVYNFGQDSSFAGAKTAQGNQDGNGIGDFYYEPPSGFNSLCSENLPSPEIALPTDHFNTVLYTGDGATTLAVSGVGFQPDFTWIKNRDQADDHTLVDSVRGATNYLVSNEMDIEVDDSTFVASLDSDGFTVGDDVVVNTSTENYASWNWKAGGTASSNTDGTITSSVSANTDAGFSIVSYTGTGSAATIGHGLSEAPELIIVKNYDTATQNWAVGATPAYSGWTGRAGELNNTAPKSASSAYWNDTVPSASVFTVGTEDNVNKSTSSLIAYCFHSIEGYSKVGSYEGNGNLDGTFVYTGFRPAFVMTKSIDSSSDWQMFDNKRTGYNVDNYELEANDSAAEDTTTEFIDIVSNGFKNRDTTDPNVAETYIYLAFAESPFKYSNAR